MTITKTSVKADSIVKNVSSFLSTFNLLTSGIITAELVPAKAAPKNNEGNKASNPIPQAESKM